MTTALIVIGVVVAVVVVLVLLINTKYGKVYADKHLIEVCEALDRVRDHGCARPEWDDKVVAYESADAVLADMRNAETSGGLRLAYKVSVPRDNPERHRHVLSMSQADRLPAEAMARFFVGLVLVRYGLPPEAVAVVRTPNLVTHLAWEIPDPDRLHFAADKKPLPVNATMNELRKESAAMGQRITLRKVGIESSSSAA